MGDVVDDFAANLGKLRCGGVAAFGAGKGEAVADAGWPVGKNGDTGRNGKGFIDFVGDKEHAWLFAPPYGKEHINHFHANAIVESGERLIHEKDGAAKEKGTGQGTAAGHAARKLPGVVVGEALQANGGNDGSDFLFCSILADDADVSRTVRQGSSRAL